MKKSVCLGQAGRCIYMTKIVPLEAESRLPKTRSRLGGTGQKTSRFTQTECDEYYRNIYDSD